MIYSITSDSKVSCDCYEKEFYFDNLDQDGIFHRGNTKYSFSMTLSFKKQNTDTLYAEINYSYIDTLKVGTIELEKRG